MREKAEELDVHRLRRARTEPHLREAFWPMQTPPVTPEQRLLELRRQATLLGWTDPSNTFHLP